MYSFYGGRPGNSFIIVKTFSSYNEMVSKFKLGPDYPDVHYDEHVLINTKNKLDEYNGRIYRRGYNYNEEETGGAEYIGTIVGPQGNAPYLHLVDPDDYKSLLTTFKTKQDHFIKDYTSSITSPPSENDESEEKIQDPFKNSVSRKNLVPGKTVKNGVDQFNDDIQWYYFSARTPDNDITDVYLGFTIPYPVFDFVAERTSAYSSDQDIKPQEIENQHPFFHQWKLKIPKGIKGDSIQNIRIIAYSGQNNIVGIPANFIKAGETKYIFVGDIKNYNTSLEGNITQYYLGEYDVLKDINIAEDGTITKTYTNSKDQNIETTLQWIKSIKLNQYGQLLVTYNTPDLQQGQNSNKIELINENNIKWIDDIELSSDGYLRVTYNTIEPGSSITENSEVQHEIKKINTNPIKILNEMELSKQGQLIAYYNGDLNNGISLNNNAEPIRWVTDISMNDDKSGLTFEWNTGDPTVITDLQWISSLDLSDDGLLKMKLNINNQQTDGVPVNEYSIVDQTSSNPGEKKYHHIKWIKNMYLDPEDGSLNVEWNYRQNENWEPIDVNQKFPNIMSRITDIRINTSDDLANSSTENDVNKNITQDDIGKIAYQINNGEYQSIGEPINYVKEMALDSENRILARFALTPDNVGTFTHASRFDPTEEPNDWISIGNVTTNFQIGPDENIEQAFWSGVGKVTETLDSDNSSISGKLNFTIAPSYYLAKNTSCKINTIKLSIQQINAEGTPLKFYNLDLSRQPAGEQPEQENQEETQVVEETQEEKLIDKIVSEIYITQTGITFTIDLDEIPDEYKTSPNYMIYPVSPASRSAKDWFCYIYIENLNITLNRTDLSGSDTDTPRKLIMQEYLEYDWDSRDGWNAAFTDDLLSKPCGGSTSVVNNLITENRKIQYFGSRTPGGGFQKQVDGQTIYQARAIRINRAWGTKRNCFYIDLVRPEPLRQKGVHIVSIQILNCDSSVPIAVYPIGGNSYPMAYDPTDPEHYPVDPNSLAVTDPDNPAQIDKDLKWKTQLGQSMERTSLECIKYGQGQYFRIVILDDTIGGTPTEDRRYKLTNGETASTNTQIVKNGYKYLNIKLRFLYYIDYSWVEAKERQITRQANQNRSLNPDTIEYDYVYDGGDSTMNMDN